MRIRGLWRLRRVARAVERYRMHAGGEPRALILMYHRIADVSGSAYRNTVSPERFAAHLEVIRSIAEPISLADCVDGIRSGRVPHRGVVVTFDDGYADNATTAAPLLLRFGIPATLFVAGPTSTEDAGFWWDRIHSFCFESRRLPDPVSVQVGGSIHTWSGPWGASRPGCPEDQWTVGQRTFPTPRHALFQGLHDLFIRLPAGQQDTVLARLETTGPLPPAPPRLSRSQIAALSATPGVQIGAHTATHPCLEGMSPSRVIEELHENRQLLEGITGAPVRNFAYPYGLFDWRTVRVVRSLGFSSACTSDAGAVWRGSDPFQLPRVHVPDEGRESFRARLEGLFGAAAQMPISSGGRRLSSAAGAWGS